MDEHSVWLDVIKNGASLGLGGLMMGVMIWFLQRANATLALKVEATEKARYDQIATELLECRTDRLELRRQQSLDRTSYETKLEALRTSYETRLNDLNGRILDIYKTRGQQKIADQMTAAAASVQGVIPTEKIPPFTP